MAPVATVALVSGLATAGVTAAVAAGLAAPADLWLLERLRVSAVDRADGKATRAVSAMRDLTALGGDTLRLLFVAACLFGLIADGRPRAGWALVAIFAGARIALFALKRIVRRPRPDAAGHAVAIYTSSFPSGHTFLAVVVYLSAALLIPAGAPAAVLLTGIAFALLLGLAIGLTRIALGIHWPSDVIAGWCAGLFWVSACILIAGGAV